MGRCRYFYVLLIACGTIFSTQVCLAGNRLKDVARGVCGGIRVARMVQRTDWSGIDWGAIICFAGVVVAVVVALAVLWLICCLVFTLLCRLWNWFCRWLWRTRKWWFGLISIVLILTGFRWWSLEQQEALSTAIMEGMQKSVFDFVKAVEDEKDKNTSLRVFDEIFSKYGVSPNGVDRQVLTASCLKFADLYMSYTNEVPRWNSVWNVCIKKLALEQGEFYIWNSNSKADLIIDELKKSNDDLSASIRAIDGSVDFLIKHAGLSRECRAKLISRILRDTGRALGARIKYLSLLRRIRRILIDEENGHISKTDAEAKLSALEKQLDSMEPKLNLLSD